MTKFMPVVLFFCVVFSAFAHHSQTLFDTTKTVTYQGTISRVSWSNPHVYFFIDAATTAGGTGAPMERMGIEGPGPTSLEKNFGWTKETLKVGDKVMVTGSPRKDGKPNLLLTGVTLPNGTKFVAKPE